MKKVLGVSTNILACNALTRGLMGSGNILRTISNLVGGLLYLETVMRLVGIRETLSVGLADEKTININVIIDGVFVLGLLGGVLS